jgi:hypothetical protein
MKLAAILFLLAVKLSAQTVTPTIVECGRKCSGQFSITNQSVQPLIVTLDPFSSALEPSGRTINTPLGQGVIQLDAMSARVSPRGKHEFGYKLHCLELPCIVTVYSSMVVGRTLAGIEVKVFLPHVIYQCERAKDCRKNVRLKAGLK